MAQRCQFLFSMLNAIYCRPFQVQRAAKAAKPEAGPANFRIENKLFCSHMVRHTAFSSAVLCWCLRASLQTLLQRKKIFAREQIN